MGVSRYHADDARALQALIRNQNAKGARMPVDLSSERYVWDEWGRLTELRLIDCGLRGYFSLGEPCRDSSGGGAFSALKRLFCQDNALDGLDLSAAFGLEILYCGDNRLEALDVSKVPDLSVLVVSGNPLKTLDVRANGELQVLFCDRCRLEALDVTHNPKLKDLICSHNRFVQLDLSANLLLERLFCEDCRLKYLDVSRNPLLKKLDCSGNPLSYMVFISEKEGGMHDNDTALDEPAPSMEEER